MDINERNAEAQRIIDETIKKIEHILFKAASHIPVENRAKAEPINAESFRKGLNQYKDFLEKDYKRRQEELKRMHDSYDALVHAIEMQKRFEKGLNK